MTALRNACHAGRPPEGAARLPLRALAAVAALAFVLLGLGLGVSGAGVPPASPSPALAAPHAPLPPEDAPALPGAAAPAHTAPALPVTARPALTAPGHSAPALSAPGHSAPALTAPGHSAPAGLPPTASAPGDGPSTALDSTLLAPASPASGTHPSAHDAYLPSGTLLLRPQRDTGERAVPAGALLFTPPYTPRVPPRPAPPAPVSGNAPPAAAHLPSDLGRAPPPPSST